MDALDPVAQPWHATNVALWWREARACAELHADTLQLIVFPFMSRRCAVPQAVRVGLDRVRDARSALDVLVEALAAACADPASASSSSSSSGGGSSSSSASSAREVAAGALAVGRPRRPASWRWTSSTASSSSSSDVGPLSGAGEDAATAAAAAAEAARVTPQPTETTHAQLILQLANELRRAVVDYADEVTANLIEVIGSLSTLLEAHFTPAEVSDGLAPRVWSAWDSGTCIPLVDEAPVAVRGRAGSARPPPAVAAAVSGASVSPPSSSSPAVAPASRSSDVPTRAGAPASQPAPTDRFAYGLASFRASAPQPPPASRGAPATGATEVAAAAAAPRVAAIGVPVVSPSPRTPPPAGVETTHAVPDGGNAPTAGGGGSSSSSGGSAAVPTADRESRVAWLAAPHAAGSRSEAIVLALFQPLAPRVFRAQWEASHRALVASIADTSVLPPHRRAVPPQTPLRRVSSKAARVGGGGGSNSNSNSSSSSGGVTSARGAGKAAADGASGKQAVAASAQGSAAQQAVEGGDLQPQPVFVTCFCGLLPVGLSYSA